MPRHLRLGRTLLEGGERGDACAARHVRTLHAHRRMLETQHAPKAPRAAVRSVGGGVGQVALVGPMRMAYATARAAVQCVAKHLNNLLT